MAVLARSGEQSRASRRGVWMLAIAPIAAIALAVGAAFAADAVYAHRALPGMSVGGVDIGSLETRSVRLGATRKRPPPGGATSVAAVVGAADARGTKGRRGSPA